MIVTLNTANELIEVAAKSAKMEVVETMLDDDGTYVIVTTSYSAASKCEMPATLLVIHETAARIHNGEIFIDEFESGFAEVNRNFELINGDPDWFDIWDKFIPSKESVKEKIRSVYGI